MAATTTYKEPTLPTGYVGNLTKEQEIALNTVKERLKDILTPRYDDYRICRFMRARHFDAEASVEMIRNDIKWREEHGVDNILETYPKESKWFQSMHEYWPNKQYGIDEYGIPIWWERIGTVEPKSLLGQAPPEALVRHHVWIMEGADRRTFDETSEKLGRKNQLGNLFIEDCSGLGWKHFYTPALSVLKTTFAIDEAHYPELLRKMYIVNSPGIFMMFWKLITPWLDPRTVAKLEIVGPNHVEVLSKVIKPEDIPSYLGGPCKENTVTGGGTFGGLTAEDNSDLKEVTVSYKDKHEIVVDVDTAQSLIGWKFTLESHDIGFGVYYEKDSEREEIHPYNKYNSTDIVEGSHVAQQTGKYVFHWDNTYSYMRKKTVNYRVFVEPPVEKVQNE